MTFYQNIHRWIPSRPVIHYTIIFIRIIVKLQCLHDRATTRTYIIICSQNHYNTYYIVFIIQFFFFSSKVFVHCLCHFPDLARKLLFALYFHQPVADLERPRHVNILLQNTSNTSYTR